MGIAGTHILGQSHHHCNDYDFLLRRVKMTRRDFLSFLSLMPLIIGISHRSESGKVARNDYVIKNGWVLLASDIEK